MFVALVLSASLAAQPSPSNFAQLATAAWNAARAAAAKGGSPESLSPARRALRELDAFTTGSIWRLQGEYAHELIEAAMAAAQEEREVMGVHLTQARSLANRLQTSRTPARWPLPIDEAEGELWLEVDHYATAMAAYQRALKHGGGPGVMLGLARSAARAGNTAVACESYRAWLTSGKAEGPAVAEAKKFVSRCP